MSFTVGFFEVLKFLFYMQRVSIVSEEDMLDDPFKKFTPSPTQ